MKAKAPPPSQPTGHGKDRNRSGDPKQASNKTEAGCLPPQGGRGHGLGLGLGLGLGSGLALGLGPKGEPMRGKTLALPLTLTSLNPSSTSCGRGQTPT